MSTIVADSDALAQALGLVKHTAANSDLERPILRNIVLDGSANGFRLYAADNYRIGMATIELADAASAETFGRALLSIDDVPAVLAFLRDRRRVGVAVTNAEMQIEFAVGTERIAFRQMDGIFPNIAVITGREMPALTVALNPKFLAEIGRATKGAVVLRVRTAGQTQPLVIEAAGLPYTEWIMPVRVEDTQQSPATTEAVAA